MSRKSIKEKRQVRTDSAIESFENRAAHSLLNSQLNVYTADQKVIEEYTLCASNFTSDQNKKMTSLDPTRIFQNCVQTALDSYITDWDHFVAYYKSDMTLLGADLDKTLDHHLYSQDFNPHWRD